VKKIYLFLSICGLAFGVIETKVTEVDGSVVRIEAAAGIISGQSAFVIREFDDSHTTVIAQCTVSGDVSSMTCAAFDYLYHDSLSLIKSGISVGDTVKIGLLNESIAIIAPDQKSYLTVKSQFPGAIVFHPDLFAVTLKYEDNPTPAKEDFVGFCRENFIGVLVFALNDAVYDVDCQSFKVINRHGEGSLDKENNKPFYHRVGEIERGFFDFGNKEVDDFTAYYKKLIGVN
jgi:hypothetical protein